MPLSSKLGAKLKKFTFSNPKQDEDMGKNFYTSFATERQGAENDWFGLM